MFFPIFPQFLLHVRQKNFVLCGRHFRVEDYQSCGRRLKRGVAPSQRLVDTELAVEPLFEKTRSQSADYIENGQQEPPRKRIRLDQTEERIEAQVCSLQDEVLHADKQELRKTPAKNRNALRKLQKAKNPTIKRNSRNSGKLE